MKANLEIVMINVNDVITSSEKCPKELEVGEDM